MMNRVETEMEEVTGGIGLWTKVKNAGSKIYNGVEYVGTPIHNAVKYMADPIDQFLQTGKYADTGLHQTESREF